VRRLHLLRHAKSAWDDPSLDDHDRPLAPRGHRAAASLRAWLDRGEVLPELVLCSTAARATQTLEPLLPALGSPPVLFDEELYHASGTTLAARVRHLPEPAAGVLLVGHNPGLQHLALLLSEPSETRDRVAAKLPTGALVTLELDLPGWSELREGAARIVRLVLPRELEAGS
jgi:phosphohistidine phosphatase